MRKNVFTQNDSESSLSKRCTKFNSFYHFDSDNRVPVVYVHLKFKGVPKKEALKFCARSYCRNDSTKVYDGPSNYRILKIHPENNPTLNVKIKLFMGIIIKDRDGK